MAISQERYVEITSGVAGGTAIAMQKLVGRVFSNHRALEPDKLYSIRNHPEAVLFFGEDSREAQFSALYFNYVSPLPATKAKELQFFLHSGAARLAEYVGADTIDEVESIKAIESKEVFVIINNGSQEEFTVDVSKAVSYSDVAEALASAIKLNVAYELDAMGRGGFVVRGDFKDLALSGAIMSACGLTQGRVIAGKDSQTLAEAIAESTDYDSFGSAIALTENTIDELKRAAELVASYNVRYQFYIDVPVGMEQEYFDAFGGTASTGLIYGKGDLLLSALPAAIMAATDYDRRNSTVNYMFRSPQITLPNQVSTNAEANRLDPIRINYYGQTQANGTKISFFQRGYLCGPTSAPLDMSVHANEQWFKALLTQEWFTLLVSQNKVPANRDGESMGLMVLEGVIEKAIFNGVISRGKTLTTNQKISIGEITGDHNAWHEVFDRGYWAEVRILEETGESGLAEYKMQYTLIYAKGDNVRKVTGSHNLI